MLFAHVYKTLSQYNHTCKYRVQWFVTPIAFKCCLKSHSSCRNDGLHSSVIAQIENMFRYTDMSMHGIVYHYHNHCKHGGVWQSLNEDIQCFARSHDWHRV